MVITKGIEIRLYPSKGQRTMINKNIDGARFAIMSCFASKKNYIENTESISIQNI